MKGLVKGVLLAIDEKVSKKGNNFKILSLVNPESYEKIELFVSEDCQFAPDLKKGDSCTVDLVFQQQGFNLLVSAVGVRKGA